MSSDFPTERDPVYGWESVHEPDHRYYKSRERMLYAGLSKLYYDRASELADIPEQRHLVGHYNLLGHKYYLLSIGQE
ncbi:MAG: hypothetical protein WC455_28480 [Dehalococcoidia bacterium]|jgi:hypothetical protein